MSTKAFNQYIDMFFKEHPFFASDFPEFMSHEQLASKIKKTFSAPESVIELNIESLSTSPNNVIVVLHPTEANNRTKQHSHDFFELMYVSRGSCHQVIGDKTVDLKAGDFCLLNPFVTHDVNTETDDTLLFNIMIKRQLFEESFLCMIAGNDLITNFFANSLYTHSKSNDYLYSPAVENNMAAEHAQSLIIEALEKKLGYQKVIENYMALLFMEFARNFQNALDKENYTLMGYHDLTEILAYINQHKLEVSLTSVAEHFHYHPKYLSSIIKSNTKKSFSEIVQEAKLQEACQYLKSTDISVDEIVQLLNYYDRSYFNKIFKKFYGITPAEYRKTFNFIE